VISRQQPQLYDYVTEAFSVDGEVDVIVDRRLSQRRRPSRGDERGTADRRRIDRRVRTDIDDELKGRGCAFVPVADRAPTPSQASISA
jgi:hypothetical protein